MRFDRVEVGISSYYGIGGRITGTVKNLSVVWVSQQWSVLCLCLNDVRFCVGQKLGEQALLLARGQAELPQQ